MVTSQISHTSLNQAHSCQLSNSFVCRGIRVNSSTWYNWLMVHTMSHNAVLLCWFPGSQIYWVEAELCISNSRHFWQAKCACVCTGMCVPLCVCYFGKQTFFFPAMHLVFTHLYNKAQDRYRWELKFISNSKMFIWAHLSFFHVIKASYICETHAPG